MLLDVYPELGLPCSLTPIGWFPQWGTWSTHRPVPWVPLRREVGRESPYLDSAMLRQACQTSALAPGVVCYFVCTDKRNNVGQRTRLYHSSVGTKLLTSKVPLFWRCLDALREQVPPLGLSVMPGLQRSFREVECCRQWQSAHPERCSTLSSLRHPFSEFGTSVHCGTVRWHVASCRHFLWPAWRLLSS